MFRIILYVNITTTKTKHKTHSLISILHMNKITLFLCLILSSITLKAQNCSYCDYVLNPSTEGQTFRANNQNVIPQPGDTICMMAGTYNKWTAFFDLHGTKENPIVITNCGGKVIINSTSTGIDVANSNDFVITGTGDSSSFYGFEISGGVDGVRCNQFSNNYKIDHVKVSNVTNHGLDLKNEPVCHDSRTWRSSGIVNDYVIVHDTYMNNIGREGFYIGGSHYLDQVSCRQTDGVSPIIKVKEATIDNCEIYNNILDGTGNDGIQVGSVTEQALIYNNAIRNYGSIDPSHRSGFQINQGTKATLYNNQLYNGLGVAFFIAGDGVEIYNNIAMFTKGGVEAYDNFTSTNSRYKIYNNTFTNLTVSGIAMLNAAFTLNENYFYNNIVHVNTGADFWGYQSHKAFAIENIKNNVFTNNLEDLKFVDPVNQNVRLTHNSLQAIDLGDCSINTNMLTDIEGNNRIQGNGCDIGAYEYEHTTLFFNSIQKKSNVKIYPNPVLQEETLTFQLQYAPKHQAFVNLIDITGKKSFQFISTQKKFSITLPETLKPGIYLAKITIDHKIHRVEKICIY